jgi:hypothetical protein
MRLAIRLLTLLALVATMQMSLVRTRTLPSVSAATLQQSEPVLKVLKVRREGKRLLVSGESFQMGAVIFVNGERQKTRNDEDNPTSLLIAKKAGKRLPADATITIEVTNTDGAKSDPFAFFTGLTLTLEDAGKPIHLKVGEQFLLLVKVDDRYDVSVTLVDESIVKKIADAGLPAGGQAIYEAQHPGQTELSVAYNPKCAKLTPPCHILTMGYQFKLIVE